MPPEERGTSDVFVDARLGVEWETPTGIPAIGMSRFGIKSTLSSDQEYQPIFQDTNKEGATPQEVSAPPLPSLPEVKKPPKPLRSTLEDALYQATESDYRKSPFIPIDAQLKLVSKEAIMKELKLLFDSGQLPSLRERDLGHWTNYIYNNVGTGGKNRTSRRLIFGILVLLGRPEWIFDFIRAGLYDKDLPLPSLQPVGPRAENALNGESELPQKLDFMQAWTWRQQKEFNDVQWQFLAPYFDMKGSVPFLQLRDESPSPS